MKLIKTTPRTKKEIYDKIAFVRVVGSGHLTLEFTTREDETTSYSLSMDRQEIMGLLAAMDVFKEQQEKHTKYCQEQNEKFGALS